MRIRPTQSTTSALPSLEGATATKGADFAATLADASDAGGSEDPVDIRPPAERWGEYGLGAQPGGYGPAPDPAQFAQFPIGAAARASPLNPNGTTMDPAFTVPGYTGRGTPVPPGFYNLAYYNRYLREGGTPLEGFAALEDGHSIAETYGTFGDGRARATSFVTGPTDAKDLLARTKTAIGAAAGASAAVATADAETAQAEGAAAPSLRSSSGAATHDVTACAAAKPASTPGVAAAQHDATAATHPAATEAAADAAAQQTASVDVDLGRAALDTQIASLIDVLLRG